MCPFKKAFPFVVLLHFLAVAGIFVGYADHRDNRVFTLLPAIGAGEQLQEGNSNKAADEPEVVVEQKPNQPRNEQAESLRENQQTNDPSDSQKSLDLSTPCGLPSKIAPAVVAVKRRSMCVSTEISPREGAGAESCGALYRERDLSQAGELQENQKIMLGSALQTDGVGQKIIPPIALKKIKPLRPAGYVGAKGKTQVVLTFTIDAQGRVAAPDVERSPSEQMTQAVMEVLPRWRFVPARENGKVIELRVRQVVEF